MFEITKQPCLTMIGLVLCLLLAACAGTETKPVELAPEDMCSFCRMAISEKRFAAELITLDGDALKFDDIGCMLDYLKEKPNSPRIAAYFVVDYETGEWVRGEAAFYARSVELKSPMSHGIVAFKDHGRAETAVNKHKGKLIRFSELEAKRDQ
jgi:copper chaperone NosL